jgi:hypothetical protein
MGIYTRLVDAGFRREPAARIAQLLTAGASTVRLGDGLVLLREEGELDADASL